MPLQRCTDVGERGHRIAEKHHAKARESRIEKAMSEIIGLCILLSESHP
jgi:hypothetical protein